MAISRSNISGTTGKLRWPEPLLGPEMAVRPEQNVEVTSLKIVQAYDLDCDPYNRTGRFLVDGMKKRR